MWPGIMLTFGVAAIFLSRFFYSFAGFSDRDGDAEGKTVGLVLAVLCDAASIWMIVEAINMVHPLW